MKELPILFKPEMIRATLREIDPKKQTRRVINKLRKFGNITEFGKSSTPGYDWHFRDKGMRWNDISHARLLELCPYGRPGDRLWVRETFSLDINAVGSEFEHEGPFVYAADGDIALRRRLCDGWTPSIFMSRWASRILLEITNVRIERLQDISERDVRAEGCKIREFWIFGANADGRREVASIVYRRLWESINGKGSWDANPWVWVIEFRKIQEQT